MKEIGYLTFYFNLPKTNYVLEIDLASFNK